MTSVSVHMTVLQQSRLTLSAAIQTSCQHNYIIITTYVHPCNVTENTSTQMQSGAGLNSHL